MNITEFLRADAWCNDTSGPRYVQLRRRIEAVIEAGLLPVDPPRHLSKVTEAT